MVIFLVESLGLFHVLHNIPIMTLGHASVSTRGDWWRCLPSLLWENKVEEWGGSGGWMMITFYISTPTPLNSFFTPVRRGQGLLGSQRSVEAGGAVSWEGKRVVDSIHYRSRKKKEKWVYRRRRPGAPLFLVDRVPLKY
jgi:hypothetical protein